MNKFNAIRFLLLLFKYFKIQKLPTCNSNLNSSRTGHPHFLPVKFPAAIFVDEPLGDPSRSTRTPDLGLKVQNWKLTQRQLGKIYKKGHR